MLHKAHAPNRVQEPGVSWSQQCEDDDLKELLQELVNLPAHEPQIFTVGSAKYAAIRPSSSDEEPRKQAQDDGENTSLPSTVSDQPDQPDNGSHQDVSLNGTTGGNSELITATVVLEPPVLPNPPPEITVIATPLVPFYVKYRKWLFLGLIVAAMIVATVTLATKLPTPRERALMRTFINISGEAVLADPGSAQSQASRWMLSKINTRLDSRSNKEAVIQCYVLAVIFYSLKGTSWTNQSGNEFAWHPNVTCSPEGGITKIRLGKNVFRQHFVIIVCARNPTCFLIAFASAPDAVRDIQTTVTWKGPYHWKSNI